MQGRYSAPGAARGRGLCDRVDATDTIIASMATTQPASELKTQRSRSHYILGTAGHIDHGKTSLVRALTGIDTDRLPEEQRRGMTIELGFAELAIGDARFGVVDVPGHERFVRTMVAGATGIDVALIVVAADDSVMPQTIEHVEILDLLGVSRAVVALTKIDRVDSDLVELVADDVQKLLASTALRDAVVCPVSSVTEVGLDALRQAILDVVRDIDPSPAAGPFRMAIDRVFTVEGRGTVVTGSALSGALQPGDKLQVWPTGDPCRVRDLQTHGKNTETLRAGQRCALNLSGVDRDRIHRGCELAAPGYLQPSRLIDVRLQALSSYGRPLKSTSVVRLEIGTAELPVRVVLFEGRALAPGASAYAQLRSGRPVTATYGQRFIIRDENATRTIGGGVVLRPVGRRRRRDPAAELEAIRRLDLGDPADRVEEVLYRAGFSTPTDLHLSAQAGVQPDEVLRLLERLDADGRRIVVPGTEVHVAPALIDDVRRRLTRWLERYQKSNPNHPGRHVDAVVGRLERMTSRSIARPMFDHFVREGALKRLGRFVCLPAFAPKLSNADEKMLALMIEQIRAGKFQPPLLDALSISSGTDRKRLERLATLACALGELVHIGGSLYVHVDVEAKLREIVTGLIQAQGGATVAQVREALGSSRKYVVPFLEYLDRVGVTRRKGDLRVLA